MALAIVWTESASRDFESIILGIAQEDPDAARRVASDIPHRVEIACAYPKAGRMLPEQEIPQLRERISYRKYRIVYWIDEDRGIVTIWRVWPSRLGNLPDDLLRSR